MLKLSTTWNRVGAVGVGMVNGRVMRTPMLVIPPAPELKFPLTKAEFWVVELVEPAAQLAIETPLTIRSKIPP